MTDKPDGKRYGLRRRLLSVMTLTTLAGALCGCVMSSTWWVIRIAFDVPMEFFGEGLGWATLFVGLHSVFWGGIGLVVGLVYAACRLWMNRG
jgi:hypothetical protein